RHPAVLACAHEAETRARPVAEFRRAHAPAVGEQCGQHRVACERFAFAAVDEQSQTRTIALGQALELSHQSMSSSRQVTSISATTALFGNASAVATSSARSAGWIISLRGIAVTRAVMSVSTKPGQTTVARTPCSQPTRRTACVSATTANLLIA